MKHVIFGTAGHIDHGKTLLTKALTGIDTDRLSEEKKRGISIELGFAPLMLDTETFVSIVDVPGHEKFVKTMIAGSAGIDAALLLVAADDGVMPQTREHLDILKLLKVKAGIIVITKCDLVDKARLQEVETQVSLLVKGSFLEHAEMIRVSAVEGTGISLLKEAMMRVALSDICRRIDQPFRLPVDRVFQIEGFGNIATGTLTEGILHNSDPVTLYPQQISGTVRSLQQHGKNTSSASAGTRTAISLSSQLRESVSRGSYIAEADSMNTGDWLDVFIEITDDCPFTIKNSSTLRLFCGTAETSCKLRLLDCEVLSKGSRAYGQLKTDHPVSTRNGDRFLIRLQSPVITIGGGVILNGSSRRAKRHSAPILERLKRCNHPDLHISLLEYFEDHGTTPVSCEHIRKTCNIGVDVFCQIMAFWKKEHVLVEMQPDYYCTRHALLCKKDILEAVLKQYHDQYPMQTGMPTSQLKYQLYRKETDSTFSWFVKQGYVVLDGQFSRLPDHTPVFTKDHKIMQRKLQHYYKDAGFLLPSKKETNRKFAHRQPYYSQVLSNMLLNKELIPLSSEYIVHPVREQEAWKIFKSLFQSKDIVTLADFRDAAGISRRYSQLFLEYWDHKGLTRRIGTGRIIIHNENQGTDNT